MFQGDYRWHNAAALVSRRRLKKLSHPNNCAVSQASHPPVVTGVRQTACGAGNRAMFPPRPAVPPRETLAASPATSATHNCGIKNRPAAEPGRQGQVEERRGRANPRSNLPVSAISAQNASLPVAGCHFGIAGIAGISRQDYRARRQPSGPQRDVGHFSSTLARPLRVTWVISHRFSRELARMVRVSIWWPFSFSRRALRADLASAKLDHLEGVGYAKDPLHL
ncbi:hypothetical protein Bbelb_090450 [Branchiostoma belcheri]|nr:hypothetical protein Bbelb_090450 [Branchiostoma belcheri]